MGDILSKFAEDLQPGRLKDVWDVQNFLVRGKDDLFQVALEKKNDTDALNLIKNHIWLSKRRQISQHLEYTCKETQYEVGSSALFDCSESSGDHVQPLWLVFQQETSQQT